MMRRYERRNFNKIDDAIDEAAAQLIDRQGQTWFGKKAAKTWDDAVLDKSDPDHDMIVEAGDILESIMEDYNIKAGRSVKTFLMGVITI